MKKIITLLASLFRRKSKQKWLNDLYTEDGIKIDLGKPE